jgi:hypothetical protein
VSRRAIEDPIADLDTLVRVAKQLKSIVEQDTGQVDATKELIASLEEGLRESVAATARNAEAIDALASEVRELEHRVYTLEDARNDP